MDAIQEAQIWHLDRELEKEIAWLNDSAKRLEDGLGNQHIGIRERDQLKVTLAERCTEIEKLAGMQIALKGDE